MKIGDVVASNRRRKRINQKAMATQLNISVSYLSQIENNSRKASGNLLKKIAETLNVPVSGLLFETMNESDFADNVSRELFIKAKPMMDKMLEILLTE